MIGKYPFYIIPKHPEKINEIQKILDTNSDYREKRLKDLNCYLNYLAKHPIIQNTEEFKLFVGMFDFVRMYM